MSCRAQKPGHRKWQRPGGIRRHLFGSRSLLPACRRRQPDDGQHLPHGLFHRWQIRVARRLSVGSPAGLRRGFAGERRDAQAPGLGDHGQICGLRRSRPQLVHPQPRGAVVGRIHHRPCLLSLRLVHRGLGHRQHRGVRPSPPRDHRVQGKPLLPGRRRQRAGVRDRHVGQRQERKWSCRHMGRRRGRHAGQKSDRARLGGLHRRFRPRRGQTHGIELHDALGLHGHAAERGHRVRPGPDRGSRAGHVSRPDDHLLARLVGEGPPPHRRGARLRRDAAVPAQHLDGAHAR